MIQMDLIMANRPVLERNITSLILTLSSLALAKVNKTRT